MLDREFDQRMPKTTVVAPLTYRLTNMKHANNYKRRGPFNDAKSKEEFG